MNTQAKQLRELHNKIIHKGNVPLKFECKSVNIKNEEFVIEQTVKSISKPVSVPVTLQEVLLMLGNTYGDYKIEVFGNGIADITVVAVDINDDPIDVSIHNIDLTKQIEEQDEEVLKKLIELVS